MALRFRRLIRVPKFKFLRPVFCVLHLPTSCLSGSGTIALQVRTHNRLGEQQPAVSTWNPSGYARNVIETTPVLVV
jgi:hypothetical protein